jgi:hypothetical protein
MPVAIEETAMAKKSATGRPGKPDGQGKMVRLNPRLVAMARIVAGDRGVAMGDYLSEYLMEPVKRDYQDTLRKLDRELKGGDE